MNKLLRNKKGAALVEYALVVAGVALISAAAVSIFGHKTSDMLAATATVLPGAHADDNGAIVSGKLIETTGADAGTISDDDLDLFKFVETADEAMAAIDHWHLPATKRDGIPGR